mgnify:CR=1 FL=1
MAYAPHEHYNRRGVGSVPPQYKDGALSHRNPHRRGSVPPDRQALKARHPYGNLKTNPPDNQR